MEKTNRMNIFLSYGHDEYTPFAMTIKADLERLQHFVWFDDQQLKAGQDWEAHISDGLDKCSAIPGAGRFLLLLTPHAVRRPDGYCLKELTRALERKLPVVPAMVSNVEPPLSICNVQWLDMRNCYPVEEHSEIYQKQFARLVECLEMNNLPSEGMHARLRAYLKPVPVDVDLAERMVGFTGREWVKDEIRDWLSKPGRVFWITGQAGVGKSALAAWLCDQIPEITACHFCVFNDPDRAEPRRILSSLAYQLSTQLPVYQDRLNASSLEEIPGEPSVAAIFERLFVTPLSDKVPISPTPQVLLIDALDEAVTVNRRNDLAFLIATKLQRLPSWQQGSRGRGIRNDSGSRLRHG